MKLKNLSNKSLGLGGLALGLAIYLLAGLWANYSASSSAIVGANIGAGLMGILGMAIVLAALIFLALQLRKKS